MEVAELENVDTCWDIDWSCAIDPDVLDQVPLEVAQRSAESAIEIISYLTAGRVGTCPQTVTVCFEPRCSKIVPLNFVPALIDGRIYNFVCQCGGNSCSGGDEITLDGIIGRVDEVKIDGAVLDSTSYEVQDHKYLVRTDGGSWPRRGSLEVTYVKGYLPGVQGNYAAGVLALELMKACVGLACSLPPGVQSITRGGVSFEVQTQAFFRNGVQLPAVDMYVAQYNPNQLRQAPIIRSGSKRSRLRRRSS